MAHNSYSLGFNATGVVETKVAHEDGDVILIDEMPASVVQHILDTNHENRQAGDRPGGPTGNGMLCGSMPITTWQEWKNEWKAGPRLWGQPWNKFLMAKLKDPAHKNFVTMKL